MSSSYRRTLQELEIRYEYEPSLKDVYVEGPSDKSFFEWYLTNNGLDYISVYDISSIDIPNSLLEQMALSNSNKSRVIALARYLESSLKPGKYYITCIVDADFDHILGIEYNNNYLLVTDYTCLEMYSYNHTSLQKFFGIYIRRSFDQMLPYITSLESILQKLFLLRLANYLLGWNMKNIPFRKCCEFTDNSIEFDYNEYIRRYLQANSRSADHEILIKQINDFKSLLDKDIRKNIHGHDLINILSLLLGRLIGTAPFRDATSIQRVFLLCVAESELSNEPLFVELISRNA